MKHLLQEIEDSIVNGDVILDYLQCEGIDPEIYYEYKEMVLDFKKSGVKIKEINVSKKLKRFIKKMDMMDRQNE